MSRCRTGDNGLKYQGRGKNLAASGANSCSYLYVCLDKIQARMSVVACMLLHVGVDKIEAKASPEARIREDMCETAAAGGMYTLQSKDTPFLFSCCTTKKSWTSCLQEKREGL